MLRSGLAVHTSPNVLKQSADSLLRPSLNFTLIFQNVTHYYADLEISVPTIFNGHTHMVVFINKFVLVCCGQVAEKDGYKNRASWLAALHGRKIQSFKCIS